MAEMARVSRNCLLGTGLVLGLLTCSVAGELCFPAIFNFGDSTSDTGGIHSTFPLQTPAEFPPYGDTYLKRPWNRYSDGRLFIDFIAQGLDLKYPSSYMQPGDSDFEHGANFATAGATVMPVTFMSPFPLPMQYLQFIRFQRDVVAMRSDPATSPNLLARLPKADVFSKALYTIALGGNDFTFGYTQKMTIEEVDQYSPNMADGLVNAVKLLYEAGGRNFVVWDIEPFGCLPYMLTVAVSTFGALPREALDENGCLAGLNAAARRFNDMLRDKFAEARLTMEDASIHVLSTYDMKVDLIANLSGNGFQHYREACCGVPSDFNYHLEVNCGKSKTIKGVEYVPVKCENPDDWVVWDGVHNTEAGNRYLARKLFSGDYFDVPFPKLASCSIKELS